MSDDEYDDELPSICVNSTRGSGQFEMPAADVLASQRAREEECERELLALRETLRQSDSSGSEGEVALATATANALRIQTPGIEKIIHPDMKILVQQLLDHCPYSDISFLQDYLNMVDCANEQCKLKITNKMMCVIIAASADLDISSSCEDTQQAIVCVCAWLGAACASETDCGLRPARALQALLYTLEERLDILGALSAWLCGSWAPGSLARLCGACAGSPALSAAILRRALQLCLGGDLAQAITEKEIPPISVQELTPLLSARWRKLDVRQQHVALQLIGRVLALLPSRGDDNECEKNEHMSALFNILTHTASANDNHRPEKLKVIVEVSKLQLLFRIKK